MAKTTAEQRQRRQYRRQMKEIRNASAFLGACALMCLWWGLLIHNSGTILGHTELQNHPEKYRKVSENWNYFDEYHVWIIDVAGALILLVELFAAAVHFYLPLEKHRKFTAISHFVAVIVLVVAVFLLFLYVANVYQATCGENGYVTRKNLEIQARNNNKTGNDTFMWSEFNCPAAAFLSSASVSTSLSADVKNWPGYVGFYALLFVFIALPTLCQAVHCTRIFLLVSNHKIVNDSSSPTRSKGDYDSVPLSSRSSIDSGL